MVSNSWPILAPKPQCGQPGGSRPACHHRSTTLGRGVGALLMLMLTMMVVIFIMRNEVLHYEADVEISSLEELGFMS